MRYGLPVLIFLFGSFYSTGIEAQEITPRLFWPTPKDTTVLVAGYAYSTGDVFFDTTVPVEDVDADLNTGVLAYARTLGLFGRTSNLLVEVPYTSGTIQGLLEGQPASRDVSAVGDIAMTLNVNLMGAPSMNRDQFMAFRQDPKPIVGASLRLVMPTGSYDKEKAINVGANRWAARFKLGSVFILQSKLLLEVSASAWFYQSNDSYLAGKKEQEPVFAMETNLIKRFRPGLWASLDLTYYRGGLQTIGGNTQDNSLSNLKLGGTLVIPFHNRHGIKIGYATGVITRLGTDFDQVLLSYQYVLR